MELKRYQQKAVRELVEKAIGLLGEDGRRHQLVFKAPTGSGKTVMASAMLAQLNAELSENADVPFSQVAYIWVAPNKLHEQSYFKMKNYFTETRDIRPVVYDEIDHSFSGYIKAGEVLFVNWESINRDNARMIRDNELSSSLYEITRRTQEEYGLPIIVIIDEEHMFAANIKTKTEEVLKNIQPKVEIRMSATPITSSDNIVTVPRSKVIKEEMIKQDIIINPSVDFDGFKGSLVKKLVDQALEKREELVEAYQRQDVNINPLLLIQLPSDSDKFDEDDSTVRVEVEQYLKEGYEISADNGRLAVWLSSEKRNLDGVERFGSNVDVLLFKQAIALGWDCPRAAVLLIFRKMQSFTFSAQTVGRILRMPEQRYYEDGCLNKGYVYTNLSSSMMEILRDDMNYISTALTARRREGLNNIRLISQYFERLSSDRNRLVLDFKDHLGMTFAEKWGVEYKGLIRFYEKDNAITMDELNFEEKNVLQSDNRKRVSNRIKIDVRSVGIDIIKDLAITGEVGKNKSELMEKHTLTHEELALLYNSFCSRLIGTKFEKLSITTLAYNLKEVVDALFGLSESEVVRIVLWDTNLVQFEDVIMTALDTYIEKRNARRRSKEDKLQEYEWEVPEARSYVEYTHMVREDVRNHALKEYIELKEASNPERDFTTFLEANSEYIDWWYKNGDSGKQHFSIAYINTKGENALFYVDFIIRMSNGNVYLFDTKTRESDVNAPAKHNALLDYIDKYKDKHLAGGILIKQGSNWKYSKEKIENTTDLTRWDSFYPCNA